MAYVQSAVSPRHILQDPPCQERSWFSWLLAVLERAAMRQAEREMARYFRTTGGTFTDESEREVARRLSSHP